ncbi:MAG: metalloregulator ArsR/SmtB family transcription factor [Candidatus Marinimicrobia bacterium]|nr:metalloregulator ArsR/SmtB family transcription factor [Candidatus Neomarinimicrobiota bacterium]MDD5582947.1 metalloregulator ArsR/SmtB family transcription factor [Candidatus Neomarinimicrobiota bacterium]
MGNRRHSFQKKEDPICSPEALKKLSTTFKVLGHPARIKILQVLNGKEYSVSQIQELIGEGQPVTSQHLKVMTDHDLLNCRRHGTHVLYSQNDTEFSKELTSYIVRELMDEDDEEVEN